MTELPCLRWGLIGAARIARSALIPALNEAGQDVAAVAARDPAKAAAFADEFDLRAFESYADLIAAPDIDAVYIALTNDAHLRWVTAALEAGKHVLCEKPLALTAAEVETMRAAEQRSGRVLMEAWCHIFHPRWPDVLALVRDGRLGDLVTVELSITNPLRETDDFRWQRSLGGGVAFDLLGYCTTLVIDIAGREPDSVAARHVMRGEVDLTTAAVLDFGSTLATVHASFAGTGQQNLKLVGTEGVLTLEHPISNKDRELTLNFGDDVRTYPPVNPYRLMVEDFVRAATGIAPLRFPSSASLAHARLTDRIFAAARAPAA